MIRKIEKDNIIWRSFALDRDLLDIKDRVLTLSFSSETPVKRYGDSEILLHGPGNVDLERINNIGALLFNHNANIIIGQVVTAKISNKRGVAKVKFDDDEESIKIMKKVASGSLRGISVGYRVHNIRHIEEKEIFKGIKGPAYAATFWEPHEISLTPIPMDASVGVNRMRSIEGLNIITKNENEIGERKMTEEEIKALIDAAIKANRGPTAEEITASVRAAIAEDAKPKMVVSVETFQSLLSRAGAISIEMKSKVADMAADGKDEVTIQREMLSMNADTRDGGGNPDDNKGSKSKSPVEIRTFEDVEDDDFFAGLSNPSSFAM